MRVGRVAENDGPSQKKRWKESKTRKDPVSKQERQESENKPKAHDMSGVVATLSRQKASEEGLTWTNVPGHMFLFFVNVNIASPLFFWTKFTKLQAVSRASDLQRKTLQKFQNTFENCVVESSSSSSYTTARGGRGGVQARRKIIHWLVGKKEPCTTCGG